MDLKDIQIDILTKTIAGLMRENSEYRAAFMVMQNEKSKQQEVPNGEHQNSTVDECNND